MEEKEENSLEGQKNSTLSPTVRYLSGLLGASTSLIALAWAADLPQMMGFVLFTEQFITSILGLCLGLVFISRPAYGDTRSHLPWYDALAALTGLGVCGYIAIDYPQLVNILAYSPPHAIVIGACLLVLIVEGLRRVVGWPLTSVILIFIAYGVIGHLIPGSLAGRPVSLSRLILYLGLDTNAVLGTPLIVGSTIVIPFIFMGQILLRSGGSDFFTDISMVLMGRFRGGAAKIAIVASALFGSISGSAVSNVVTTGVVTIPLMRKSGYQARSAAAIEAVASTGGQLMPPIMGAAAFLMAEFLEVPYTDVVVAATVPAILYFFALFIQADLEAAKMGIDAIEKEKIPEARSVLSQGWHFPIPFIILIIALFQFNLTPQKSALLASAALVVSGMLLGYNGKRVSFNDLIESLKNTGAVVLDLILICASAGIAIGILNITGLGFGLTLLLVQLGSGSIHTLLIVAALISIILGMGMPTVGVYVLLATLVSPALVEMGISPIAAHLFVLYYGMMSMITPPVALAAFAASSIARVGPMITGITAVRFAWSAYIVPFLFIFSPSLLLIGDVNQVILDVITAFAGVWFISVGIVGYFIVELGSIRRLVFIIAGFALMIPANVSGDIPWMSIIGVCLGVVLVFNEININRRMNPA